MLKKQHYHLCAARVIYTLDDGEPQAAYINTTLTSDDGLVGAKQIGRAQQSVQMLLLRREGMSQATILDVCMMSVSYLGEFTEKSFMAGIEGARHAA